MQTEFAEETEGEELGQAEVRGNSPLSKKAAKGKRLTISNMKMVQSKLKGESEVMARDSLFSLSMFNKVESDLLKNLEKELATYKRRLDERDTHISKVEKKNQELFDELIRAKRTSKEQQSKQEQKILGLERKEEEIQGQNQKQLYELTSVNQALVSEKANHAKTKELLVEGEKQRNLQRQEIKELKEMRETKEMESKALVARVKELVARVKELEGMLESVEAEKKRLEEQAEKLALVYEERLGSSEVQVAKMKITMKEVSGEHHR